ncbi:MAG: 4Fe-4S dicluster domain-containing protein [Methanocellales archaeon]
MIKLDQLDPKFKYEIANEPGGEKILTCYSCASCSVICPINQAGEKFSPRKIIHKALLGMREEVLTDEKIWLCVNCYACYDYCPHDVRITEIMGALREIAKREEKAGRIKISSDRHKFEEAFAESIKKYGRVHELGAISGYLIKTKGIGRMIAYSTQGISMFRKGKLALTAKAVKDKMQIERIFKGLNK